MVAELGKFPVSRHPLRSMRVGDTFYFILFYFTYGDKESKNCKTQLESELDMRKKEWELGGHSKSAIQILT